MRTIRRISSIMFIFLTIISCTDGLQLAPTSTISNESFWKTEEDAYGALYGMYARLRLQAVSNLYIWGESRSDVMAPNVASTGGYQVYYQNSLSRSVTGPTWQGMYLVVHDVNLILKYVPSITFSSEADRNDLLAQAHSMRAFLYFVMARTWGGVPLVTDPTESYDSESINRDRASVSEIFNFIKEEISIAESLFADNEFPAGRNLWSGPALNALKAEVYLWTAKVLGGGDADLRTVLDAIDEIEASDVELLEEYSAIFEYSNKGNKEILMSIRFHELETERTAVFADAYTSAAYFPLDASQVTKDLVGVFGGSPYWQPSDFVRSRFSTDDIRRVASFVEIHSLSATDSIFRNSVCSKFSGTVGSGIRHFADDIILFRFAEILLMKAEAKNAIGEDPSEEINRIRRRAYKNAYAEHEFLSGSREFNDEQILNERLLEFLFEGKRWWDLIRFDKVYEFLPSMAGKTRNQFLWPIAETTLSLEPGISQNPDY